jgi:hypothetical protein
MRRFRFSFNVFRGDRQAAAAQLVAEQESAAVRKGVAARDAVLTVAQTGHTPPRGR